MSPNVPKVAKVAKAPRAFRAPKALVFFHHLQSSWDEKPRSASSVSQNCEYPILKLGKISIRSGYATTNAQYFQPVIYRDSNACLGASLRCDTLTPHRATRVDAKERRSQGSSQSHHPPTSGHHRAKLGNNEYMSPWLATSRVTCRNMEMHQRAQGPGLFGGYQPSNKCRVDYTPAD